MTADPTAEEVAAITAAVEVLWPRPVVADEPAAPSRWRFSGRWWSKPVPSRRDRPWQMARRGATLGGRLVGCQTLHDKVCDTVVVET